MPKPLLRPIIWLWIVCLLVDPVAASGIPRRSFSSPRHSLFESQALAPAEASPLCPYPNAKKKWLISGERQTSAQRITLLEAMQTAKDFAAFRHVYLVTNRSTVTLVPNTYKTEDGYTVFKITSYSNPDLGQLLLRRVDGALRLTMIELEPEGERQGIEEAIVMWLEKELRDTGTPLSFATHESSELRRVWGHFSTLEIYNGKTYETTTLEEALRIIRGGNDTDFLAYANSISASGIATSRSGGHHYTLVPEEESASILAAMRDNVARQVTQAALRFAVGMSGREQDVSAVIPKLLFNDSVILHNGLLRDESGVLWILKDAQRPAPHHSSKNDRRREMLAYLMARGRANYVEIRFISWAEKDEISNLPDGIIDPYLVRLVTAENIPLESLPQQDYGKATAAILVADVLLRKWDPHIYNIGYVNHAPVAVDHDKAFDYRDMSGAVKFPRFMATYAFHNILILVREISSVLGLCPIAAKAMSDDIFLYIVMISLGVAGPNTEEVPKLIRAHDFGSGINALMLWDSSQLRQSIKDFSSIPESQIVAMARFAGFYGQTLYKIVRFIRLNQSRLIKDVEETLRYLTNKPDIMSLLESAERKQINDISAAA